MFRSVNYTSSYNKLITAKFHIFIPSLAAAMINLHSSSTSCNMYHFVQLLFHIVPSACVPIVEFFLPLDEVSNE